MAYQRTSRTTWKKTRRGTSARTTRATGTARALSNPGASKRSKRATAVLTPKQGKSKRRKMR